MVKSIYKDIIGAGDCVITEKDIMRMATLAKLELKTQEVPFYISEVQRMLDYAEAVNIEDSAEKVSEAEFLDFNSMREDVVSESFTVSEILSNAEKTEGGFIKLRKRAENE